MAKEYLTYEGLKKYDSLIKDYIGEADARAIKSAKIENGFLLLYKVESPAEGDAPDFNLELPSGKTYTFEEGDVDGAFNVTDNSGATQNVKIHGPRAICFGDDDEDELILYSPSAEDMLAEAATGDDKP